MVISVTVLPRVDQLTKVMPNFWRAVYINAREKRGPHFTMKYFAQIIAHHTRRLQEKWS